MAGKIPQVWCLSGLYWTRYSQFKNSTIYWSIYQVNFEVFLHSVILLTIGPINTKLQNFVNVGFLFLILWVSCCSVYPIIHGPIPTLLGLKLDTSLKICYINTKTFTRKLDILTCENNMLSSHVKILTVAMAT